MVDALDCEIMNYAWGSRSAIAGLMGRERPSSEPEAELWMGAHPLAPSRLVRDDSAQTLDGLIAKNPRRELGANVADTFGGRLPFLFKILAAAEPLSLQAHPDAARAKAGFEEENRRGIALSAPTRSYKDSSHKPELLCALTPTYALCGFREVRETLRLFDELGATELEPLLAPLRASPDARGLATTFGAWLAMAPESIAPLVRSTAARCGSRGPSTSFALEHAWAKRLDTKYPGDVGVLGALLLNLVRLEVGEAIYLDAGILHAYLDGVGVEIMASSDNVLRGGLTTKHVDRTELLRVLDFRGGPVSPRRAQEIGANEVAWETPAREFQLSAFNLTTGAAVTRKVSGPEILLCTQGSVVVQASDGTPEVMLSSGQSAFVSASSRTYTVRGDPHSKRGSYIFRAAVNLA